MTKIMVVYGAPCSGKTTYVENEKGENSLIYDFDCLMESFSGLGAHVKNNFLVDLCLASRDLVIKEAEKKP